MEPQARPCAVISVLSAPYVHDFQPILLELPAGLRDTATCLQFLTLQLRFRGRLWMLTGSDDDPEDPIRYRVYLNAQTAEQLDGRVKALAMCIKNALGISSAIQKCHRIEDVHKLCA